MRGRTATEKTKETHSRTLWFCSGCKKGLLSSPAGVLESDAACTGSDILDRGFDGLNSPGEESGVLLPVQFGSEVVEVAGIAVCRGGCRALRP